MVTYFSGHVALWFKYLPNVYIICIYIRENIHTYMPTQWALSPFASLSTCIYLSNVYIIFIDSMGTSTYMKRHSHIETCLPNMWSGRSNCWSNCGNMDVLLVEVFLITPPRSNIGQYLPCELLYTLLEFTTVQPLSDGIQYFWSY